MTKVNAGDRVRLTWQYDGATITVEGVAKCFVTGGFPGGGGWGIYRLDDPGATVEVLERALPPEPPVGSIAAATGGSPWLRYADGWRLHDGLMPVSWRSLCTPDLKVLREGWGE